MRLFVYVSKVIFAGHIFEKDFQDNIIFGAPFEEERYNKVIEQCGLKRDLTLFEAGDKTEVGEKGITLR